MGKWFQEQVKKGVKKFEEAVDDSKPLGKEDFSDGVVANAMVGGDNAARSVAVGMVLGAYHGASAVPVHLRETLNAWTPAREEKLSTLPLLKKTNPSAAAEL